MAAKKAAAKKWERCPHCRAKSLTATTSTKIDTEDVKVKVWKCTECDYSEGRPIEEA